MNLRTKKSIESGKSIKKKEKWKNLFKLLLKIGLTILAVYLVMQKIDIRETVSVFTRINIGWLLLAYVFFNISKIISAFRLQKFLSAINILLSNRLSLRLCYVGMFYNLFLPGGIGGDGYKVYLLKKWNRKGSLKKIVTSAVLDRASGMIALVFLALILFPYTSVYFIIKDPRINFLYVLTITLFYPGLFFLNKIFLKSFKKVFLSTNLQSIGVQIFQVVCAYFILKSIGINSNTIDYLDLFLVSSVVAVLPVTIGGIGARELVFIYGYEFLAIDKHLAVAFSMIFFILTAISSLMGAFIKLRSPSA